jgi:sugar fermentation stimulation protein A
VSAPSEWRYASPPVPVTFLERPNRYLARVRMNRPRRELFAHVPNPGRMAELLRPGRTRGWAVAAGGAGRTTAFDLVALQHRGTIVSIDSRVANRLVALELDAERLPEFGSGPWVAERRWGQSRFDFGVPDGARGYRALLEVKSSNLRLGRFASFPDAPTVRGTRHVRELALAAREGIRAGVLFAVQRSDVEAFRPNEDMDPAFAAALRDAARAGVHVAAHALHVQPGAIGWGDPLPLLLGPPSRAPERVFEPGAESEV